VLAFLKSISGQQAFNFFTLLSATSFLVAAVRIRRLPKSREYRPLFWLMIAWVGLYLFVVNVWVESPLYEKFYPIVVPVTWILYVFVARDLYKKVFARYPGIVVAGRWCVYTSVICSVIVLFSTIPPASASFEQGPLSWSISFDRNVVFGISLALLLLIAVMSWYPLTMEKNIAVHSFYFGAILLIQAAAQLADQSTGYRNELFWNTLAAGLTAASVIYWIFSLTQSGDTAIVCIRRNINPALEVRLLGQLDALNGILLRAARK